MSDVVVGAAVTVPSGSRVVLMVSRGADPSAPPYAAVPSVVGWAKARAVTKLESSGFSVRTISEYSDDVRRGHVIGQLPSPGASAVEGSEIVVLVSSGPAAHVRPAVILPEVVGLSEQEADSVLQTAGLAPQVVRVHWPSVPEGVVAAQLPDRASLETPPRRRAPWWAWAIVAAVLALIALSAFFFFGRQERVRVPNVTGLTQAEAVAVIQEAKLRTEVVSEPDGGAPIGSVTTQTPAAGSIVAAGSVVELRVVGEPAAATVPDVVGLTGEAAQDRLQEAGFVVRLTERQTDEARPGLVVEQSPTAGSSLSPGGRVSVVVASAVTVEAVSVPAVEGLARSDAQSTLTGAGLDVQVAENPSMQVAENVVILQYPAADSQVAPGTTVGLIVSTGSPEDATTLGLPDVVGDELPDAQERIAEAGLRSQPVSVDGSDAERNDVIAQLPPAGAAVSPGSMILLFYSSGR